MGNPDQKSYIKATILSGTAIVDVVDPAVFGKTCVAVNVPDTWDAADLSFRILDKSGNVVGLHSNGATPTKLAVTTGFGFPSRIQLPPADFVGVECICVVSVDKGTGAPLNQSADRELTLEFI